MAEASDRIEAHVWRLAAVVLLGTVMSILDTTIVNVALATLGRDLHSSISQIQWVVTGYMLALAAVIPVSGWAARRFGAKRVYLVSLVLFTAGSALCGLASSTGELVLFRVLQGIGGGMLMPIGQLMMAEAAGPKRMGRVMSIVAVPMMLAPILGPTIGGLIVQNASWEWIFYVNVPIGAIAVVLALRTLPSVKPGKADALDFRGLLLMLFGVYLGWYFPEWVLRSKSGKRQGTMRRSLPDALDLLSITVEAGLGFDAALARVARQEGGPLGEELHRVLQEMQLGKSRADALRDLGDRTSIPEFKSFVLAMIQADIFGISIAKVLHVQAAEMRTKRRQRAEEQAQKQQNRRRESRRSHFRDGVADDQDVRCFGTMVTGIDQPASTNDRCALICHHDLSNSLLVGVDRPREEHLLDDDDRLKQDDSEQREQHKCAPCERNLEEGG